MEEQRNFQNFIDPSDRLRILEQRYGLMRDRMILINQNFLSGHRNLMSDIKSIDSEIKELRNEIEEMKDIISHAVTELRECAKKDNLKVLEKYINMWNPLNFITEKEVIELIKSHKRR